MHEFLSAMSFCDSVESFYHGVLLALLGSNKAYQCDSSKESGEGRFDVVARHLVKWDLAFILEVKVSDDYGKMLSDAQKAAEQIYVKEYAAGLEREVYKKIMTYGISFCRKRCRVLQGKTLGTQI